MNDHTAGQKRFTPVSGHNYHRQNLIGYDADWKWQETTVPVTHRLQKLPGEDHHIKALVTQSAYRRRSKDVLCTDRVSTESIFTPAHVQCGQEIRSGSGMSSLKSVSLYSIVWAGGGGIHFLLRWDDSVRSEWPSPFLRVSTKTPLVLIIDSEGTAASFHQPFCVCPGYSSCGTSNLAYKSGHNLLMATSCINQLPREYLSNQPRQLSEGAELTLVSLFSGCSDGGGVKVNPCWLEHANRLGNIFILFIKNWLGVSALEICFLVVSCCVKVKKLLYLGKQNSWNFQMKFWVPQSPANPYEN